MTLTQAAILTKKGMVGFVALIILAVAGVTGLRMWNEYQLSQRPPVEEKPEMKFGALPKIKFPQSNVTSSNFSYSIDTATGGLPEVPKLIKIYFIPQTSISLLSSDKAQKLAESLGFSGNPEVLSPNSYRFADGEGGTVTINLSTGNFTFQKRSRAAADLKSETSTASAEPSKKLATKEELVVAFKDYLASRNLLKEELEKGKTNVTFKGPSSEKWETALVSILPPEWDKIPTVTSSFIHGLVKVTVSAPGEREDNFINLDYTVWPVDKTTFSTYPLKPPDQALTDLRSGLGFISIDPESPQVSVSSVFLAYFQPDEYSPYLQPVYVFEGPNFAALVPAL